MSQRQKVLSNHLTRISVTPNQQGIHEVRDKVLSTLGEQDTDTSCCQVSDLDDVEFYWENAQLYEDAVSRQGIYTTFSPTALEHLEMGGSAENPILLDEEEDKENSTPTTPVFGRPTRIPALLRSRVHLEQE